MKSKSPRETIRAFCVNCCGGVFGEVKSCDGDGTDPVFHFCPFHPYRTGKKRPSVKIMRRFCLDCQGNNMAFVRECETKNCLIHPFRFGKNPHRIGMGATRERMIEVSRKRMAVSRKKSVHFERSAMG